MGWEKNNHQQEATVRWLSLSYWFDLQIDQVAGLEARIIGIAEDSTAEADALESGSRKIFKVLKLMWQEVGGDDDDDDDDDEEVWRLRWWMAKGLGLD